MPYSVRDPRFVLARPLKFISLLTAAARISLIWKIISFERVLGRSHSYRKTSQTQKHCVDYIRQISVW